MPPLFQRKILSANSLQLPIFYYISFVNILWFSSKTPSRRPTPSKQVRNDLILASLYRLPAAIQEVHHGCGQPVIVDAFPFLHPPLPLLVSCLLGFQGCLQCPSQPEQEYDHHQPQLLGWMPGLASTQAPGLGLSQSPRFCYHTPTVQLSWDRVLHCNLRRSHMFI